MTFKEFSPNTHEIGVHTSTLPAGTQVHTAGGVTIWVVPEMPWHGTYAVWDDVRLLHGGVLGHEAAHDWALDHARKQALLDGLDELIEDGLPDAWLRITILAEHEHENGDPA